MNGIITVLMVLTLLFCNDTADHTQTHSHTETQTGIVTVANAEGFYIEFLDASGGWWLESDNTEHGQFEEGEILRLTIDTKGTADTWDDEIIKIEIVVN